MTTSRLLLPCMAVLAACALATGCATPQDQGPARLPVGALAGDRVLSPFYDWTAAVPERPGVMLRQEPMADQPEFTHAARMQRILYSSRDARWKSGSLPVSGTLYLPKGDMPEGGWPILAWAHGTLGVADVCAPSWQLHRPRDAHYLNRWLQQGFAVVATDYQGLGGPGPHPYLFWEAEGRSVLDSVRAALAAYPRQLANTVVISGQSQGSGAALGASRIAASYAPDLQIAATIATGLASTFPQGPYRQADLRFTPKVPARFTLLRLVGGSIEEGGPPAAALVSARAQPLLEMARTTCVDDMREAEQKLGIDLNNAFAIPVAELDRQLMPVTDMTPVRLPMPLFLGTGLADRTMTPQRQFGAVAALCAAGNALSWKSYPGISHNGIVNAAFDDELGFVRQVLAGGQPASNCQALQAPGEPEAVTPGIAFNN